MKYAMVLLDRVIGVEERETYWPSDVSGNPVITIQCDDTVALGMRYNAETNEFVEFSHYEPEVEAVPTQLDRIETMLQQQEISTMESAINTEYLVCLADLGI